jgi:peptide/nickel transport system substrate-binding protein
MSSRRVAIRLLIAVGLVASGLAPTLSLVSAAEGADEPVVFKVALTNEADSMNPFQGFEAPSFEMWALTYDLFSGYSITDMSTEPALATKTESSEDGLTWTFTIRDDVKFSDGEPLTSADVAHTFNRIIDGGPETQNWDSYLNGVTEVSTPDETTVVLTLDKPNSSLPLLPIPIVPEHIWSDVDEKQVKSYTAEPEGGEPVVGSGPFRFVEGKAGGGSYRFEANPDYWQGAPHIDEIEFTVFKSVDTAIQALKKGEVDFAEGLNPLQVKALQGQPDIKAINGDSPGFDEIAFNTGAVKVDGSRPTFADVQKAEPLGDGNPVLKDVKFRRALAYPVDRELINKKVYFGAGIPGDALVPPAYDAFRWDPPEDQAVNFDLVKAGQLLDEAGYALGDDGVRTTPAGKPIGTLRLYARQDSETSLKVLEYFQEWLKELGIESEVQAIEEGKLTDLILEGNFDVFEWGWYVEPNPTSVLDVLTCGQFNNSSDSWYCNEEYDKLFDQQISETDPEARAEQVKQMQEIAYSDAPYLVTSYNTIGEAVRTDRFACLRQQPDPGGVWIFQYGVYNYKNMRPAAEADACEDGSTEASSAQAADGPGSGLLVGTGLGVVALIGVAGVVAIRRRSAAADRE